MYRRIIGLLFVFVVCIFLQAATGTKESVSLSVFTEQSAVRPGESVWVALHLDVPESYHFYLNNPGSDPKAPPQLEWSLPDGFKVLAVDWPPPGRIESEDMVSYGYEKPLTILANLQVPANAVLNKKSTIKVGIRWLACTEEMCVPGSETKSLDLSIANEVVWNSKTQTLFLNSREAIPAKEPDDVAMLDEEAHLVSNTTNGFEGGVILAIAMAFLGGMILNLMPCVLPVISFKILSFVNMAGQNRSTTLRHGLFFAMGVLVSFWVLAILLLVLQAYGNAVGWGFQLQEPLFVGILASVLLIFSLSLFGVFEFGAFFASWVGTHGASNIKQEGLFSSFCSGILATAVATPCTGPFLGSAIGFAVTLPSLQALAIFTSLGLGMAFPYLLLSAFPQLLRFMPKPGAWMESFKQLMGFVMLASVIWLIWVFGFQTGETAQVLLLIGFFVMALACWIYGRWAAPHRSNVSRWVSLVLTLVLLVTGGQCVVTASQTVSAATNATEAHAGGWVNFDPDKVIALQEQGVPVFVDFTAKWCLICQTNHLLLSTDDISKEMEARGVVKMKADWTKSDPMITEYLKQHGRNGVPLYLLFKGTKEGKPHILPQVLTKESVMTALNQLPSEGAKVN